jgi:beta-glucosidase/6-phospho-beta-glucosidase/beta-galactosidase
MDRKVTFPKDFYWGVSTASHQVEGGTENQWSVWELANATELAKTAEAKYGHLPNWEEVKKRALY